MIVREKSQWSIISINALKAFDKLQYQFLKKHFKNSVSKKKSTLKIGIELFNMSFLIYTLVLKTLFYLLEKH